MRLPRLDLGFTAGVLQQLNFQPKQPKLGKSFLKSSFLMLLLFSFLIFITALPSTSFPHFLANGYSSNPGFITVEYCPA